MIFHAFTVRRVFMSETLFSRVITTIDALQPLCLHQNLQMIGNKNKADSTENKRLIGWRIC